MCWVQCPNHSWWKERINSFMPSNLLVLTEACSHSLKHTHILCLTHIKCISNENLKIKLNISLFCYLLPWDSLKSQCVGILINEWMNEWMNSSILSVILPWIPYLPHVLRSFILKCSQSVPLNRLSFLAGIYSCSWNASSLCLVSEELASYLALVLA